MGRQLAKFSGRGYDKGRNRVFQALWVLTSFAIFERLWCPPKFRVFILRGFGAKVGSGVLIRHGVRIHWPWKLRIGNDVWIGVDAWLLNLEPITIGSDVCISQAALLCTGSHDAASDSFEFDNAPITVGDGAWIATQATILRGVAIGAHSVIGARALVTGDVPVGARVLAPKALVVTNGNAS
ncbi:putative colanic acid biosynthesis acetyltransferase [Arthrobacter sp. IA7]|uniref:putative colanic acid biosynthesis acetyltransferase n=1 Tax=Arthrobacter ipis TaxID=2716202 RepID=UPI0016869B9F|nr:putative colanic acid biosynthesis acetyltransferase [Arthrobacter ipis]MBD1541861.1 putative colanic acid biosynthesis acetyltransferase [Arthrobacter ipis]